MSNRGFESASRRRRTRRKSAVTTVIAVIVIILTLIAIGLIVYSLVKKDSPAGSADSPANALYPRWDNCTRSRRHPDNAGCSGHPRSDNVRQPLL